RAFDADARKSILAQDFQLLRDGRLGDPKLPRDDRDDFTRRMLASSQQLQDSPSDWIAEDVEGVHQLPVKNAMVRSAFARASSGSSPPSASASPHASPLAWRNALPSSDRVHASQAA